MVVLLVDGEGRIVDAHGACDGRLGFRCADLVGGSMDRFGPEAVQAVREGFASAQDLHESDVLVATRPGESRAVRVTLAKTTLGEARGVVVLRETPAIGRVASIDEVLERVTDGFIAYDQEWRFTYLNHAAERYFQRRREELLGRVVWEVFPEAVGTQAERVLRAAAADGHPTEFEMLAPVLQRRVAFRVFPSSAGLAIYFRDVTEERERDAALRASEERFRSLFENALDGVMLTTVDGGILSANPAACRMLGRTEDEIRAAGRAGVVAPGPALAAMMAERERHGYARGQVEMVRKDGTHFPADVSSSVFAHAAGQPRTSLVFRDLTERVRAEERLHAAVQENERLYREALQAKRLREDVLGVVSHDLRNPLNAIVLSARVLARRVDAEELETIRGAVSRAELLIRDLLLAARVEAGGMTLDRRPEDVRSLVDDAVALHRTEAAERSVSLAAVVGGEVPRVVVDRHRVAQVLGNLLGNALKLTPAGGRVRVEAHAAAGDRVAVSVSDTGPGIALEEQEHLFDRYWQGAAGRRADAGLGLAIAKGIVDAHGGTIRVESAPGRGATFTFTLPAEAAGGRADPG